MKELLKCSAWLIRGLLICTALLLVAGCATKVPVGHDGVPSAKVVRLKGDARYSTGGDVWQPLKVGNIVKPGTAIQTDDKSHVDLVLGPEMVSYQPSAEQNWIRIWGKSLLSIDKLTVMHNGADVVTDTQLDLKAGHIYGVVPKMSAGSRYEVKLPNGVAGIRGTVYDISAEGVVKVFQGSVVLAYVGPDGSTQTQVIMGSPKSAPLTGAPPAISEPWRKWPPSRRF